MRNTTLAKFANSVPYVKELRPLAKSAMGCILLKQLEYWTFRMIQKGKPKGCFYKFLSPTYKLGEDGKPEKDANGNLIIQERNGYKLGKSWCEELGFSEDEFTTAFGHFGIRYGSKKAYVEALKTGNIFKRKDNEQDALYASFYDRQTHLTWYIRNHALVDSLIDKLFNAITVNGKEGLSSPQKSDYSTADFPFPVPGDFRFPITTEITSSETTAETTSNINTTPAAARVNDGRLPLDCFDEEDPEAASKPPSEPAPSTATPSAQPGNVAPAAGGNVEKPGRGKGKPAEPWDVEGFEAFYAQYPIHKGRSDAQGAWNRLRPNAELKATIMHDLAVRKAEDADWLRGFGIKWPQGYLNQKCWTDEIRRIKPGQPPPGPRKGFVSKAEEEEARRKASNQHLMSIINGQEVV